MLLQHLGILALLLSGTDAAHPLAVSEIVESFGAPRSTASLILKNLTDLGFVRCTQTTGSHGAGRRYKFHTNTRTISRAIAAHSRNAKAQKSRAPRRSGRAKHLANDI
jgi:DNA-binding IclR family transcriptional regulator